MSGEKYYTKNVKNYGAWNNATKKYCFPTLRPAQFDLRRVQKWKLRYEGKDWKIPNREIRNGKMAHAVGSA